MPNQRLFQIESDHLWPDFHATFLNYWRESIAESLPLTYDARVGEQVCLFSSAGDQRRFGPDISVIRSTTPNYVGSSNADSTWTATLDHVHIEEEVRTSRIEIIHRPSSKLVAVLELLSPSNKIEPGRERYLIKRNELLMQPVHRIEVDLLISSQRLPHQQALPEGEYYAFVSRVESRFKCSVTAWCGDTALPTISIPLLQPDPDLSSSLQIVFDTAYEKGRYARP